MQLSKCHCFSFDELLGKQLKKDVPFELEKDVYNYNHIEDFKHLLLDNSFRIDVEVDGNCVYKTLQFHSKK